MRHFDFLSEDERRSLFAVAPMGFDRDSPPSVLAVGLGASLYTPATRRRLADDARRAAAIGATSQVWCLEDAIAHEDVAKAQVNVVAQLTELQREHEARLPLLFVRVRSPQQIIEITQDAGGATRQLTGFVLPKIAPDAVGESFLRALVTASEIAGQRMYGMPVLEHEHLAWNETRQEHLRNLRAMFDAYRDNVLALRVGGTDLCGLFGLRRDRDTIIWDVAVVRDVLADVLNTFARSGGYTCTGPVWEHFSGPDRLFKPQLRATPFEKGGRMRLRQQLLRADADGLLREVLLDRANGFHGKSVIHPSHVAIVNTLHAVSLEEYDDARPVVASRHLGGVVPSSAGNKMNEMGPHGLWAEQVLARAQVYGVLAKPDAVVELLQRGWTVAGALYRAAVPPLAAHAVAP